MRVQLDPSLLGRCERAIAAGDIALAYDVTAKSIDFYKDRGDLAQAGVWLNKQSYVAWLRGGYDEAAVTARESVEIQPCAYERALALCQLAGYSAFRGFGQDALAEIRRADEIAGFLERDIFLRARLTERRASVQQAIGETHQAIADYSTAVQLMCEASQPVNAVVDLANLADLLIEIGALRHAEERILMAFDLQQAQPRSDVKAVLWMLLGRIYSLTGRYTEAHTLLLKSKAFFEKAGFKGIVAFNSLYMAELQERKGSQAMARKEADRALKLAKDINFPEVVRRIESFLPNLKSARFSVLNVSWSFHNLVFSSQAMRETIARLQLIAPTDEVVLITGETGTGKELVAHAIHLGSKRKDAPFVPFNCSALSRDLIESRLFGHHKGAFTGADSHNPGVIRSAQGGTLLLDEIGDLSLEAQGALLRFLQSSEIQPVGAAKPVKVDLRVIAATNRNLLDDVRDGKFRSDLYYRLNVTNLNIPPLRCRTQDILTLVTHFTAALEKRFGCSSPELSKQETARLLEYEWPGNVRQLENYVKKRVLLGPDVAQAEILDEERGVSISTINDVSQPLLLEKPSLQQTCWTALSKAEKQRRIALAVANNRGNISAAARALGLDRRTVQRIMRRSDRQH